jgi:hypothetical protein
MCYRAGREEDMSEFMRAVSGEFFQNTAPFLGFVLIVRRLRRLRRLKKKGKNRWLQVAALAIVLAVTSSVVMMVTEPMIYKQPPNVTIEVIELTVNTAIFFALFLVGGAYFDIVRTATPLQDGVVGVGLGTVLTVAQAVSSSLPIGVAIRHWVAMSFLGASVLVVFHWIVESEKWHQICLRTQLFNIAASTIIVLIDYADCF